VQDEEKMKKEFKEALRIIYEKLKNTNIKWALIGSTNMNLQGIDVNPRDLDMVVTLENLKKIPEIFKEFSSSEVKKLPPMTSESGWEVKLKISSVDVQVLGEKNTGEYVSKLLRGQLTKIKLDDVEIPCFTLKAEAQTYAETNRLHKAEIINKFLENKK